MNPVRKMYLAAGGVFAAGLLLFAREAVRTPARFARWQRRQGDWQELQRIAAARRDLVAVAAALNRLPLSSPASLEQLAAAWPELRPTVHVETQPVAVEGWSVLRANVAFEDAPFDRVWAVLSKAGEAEQRPPWRLIEAVMTPSAPGRGRAVLTLESVRKIEPAPDTRRVEP
jgi:hypothetical protein